MRLRNNTPYMVRNDGRVFECENIHPYIIYEPEDDLELIISGITSNPEWLIWFYRSTLQEDTRKRIVRCVQYLANILHFIETHERDDLPWLGELESIGDLLKVFHIQPKEIAEVTPSTLHTLEELFRELNNLTNQEFLRVRTGGEYWEENSEEIFFRVSSVDFNWFDIIWQLVYDNRSRIAKVTIESDRQSGKKEGLFVYVINGKAINHMPVEEFLTLEGNPVVESTRTTGTVTRKLREGRSLIEALGDFGPFHNNNKIEARKRVYLRENFRLQENESTMDVEQLMDELGLNLPLQQEENGSYTAIIEDSNDYGKVMSTLNKAEGMESMDEGSYVTMEDAVMKYKYEDQFMLSLIADFEDDTYELLITEI